MNIGFDAKMAYHNGTGLGHFSRTLINSLSQYYPGHEYFLFNPRPSSLFQMQGKNIHEVLPSSPIDRIFSVGWRDRRIKKDLEKHKIDLYHGLDHELPDGIAKTGMKSVVTIHDLIYERYPKQFSPRELKRFSVRFRYACEQADMVIAISRQTREDILNFYKTPEEKIVTCYQSCNPAFGKTINEEEKQRVRKMYGLPGEFFLYVGSVIERKNLLTICKAVFLLRNEITVPLVVIGDGKTYKQQVKDYIRQNGLEKKIIFLSDNAALPSSLFQTAVDFPAIYQSAIAMIYPSFFEGFGIPVLEALWSRLPVITSCVSCLPETGGDAAYYVNPNSAEEIAEGMKKICDDGQLRETMKEKGWKHAQNFTQQKSAAAIMKVYDDLVRA
ncbi:MAG TPA: glycosyltransferase family 1 protein [Chitinophagaceae bacterium]|nr:glycosyltransferase family 1 protein [Chitinophagaceae bacterium]